MPDLREVFQMSTQKVRPDRGFAERQAFRQRRRMRNRRIGAYALVATIVAIAVVAIAVIRSETSTVPADHPTPTEDLGIFAPVAGQIVYADAGGLWAVDPDLLSGSTQALLHEDGDPLGWSKDGTELLVTRWVGCCEGTYYVLHADGTETRVPDQPSGVGMATAAISPDGSRVAFENQGVTVVSIEDGGSVKLPYPAGGEPSGPLTFSPDGTQIAYAAGRAVWVVDANGRDAHQLLTDQPVTAKDVESITWSPAGDRIAIGMGGAIYTFAPDGSNITKVASDGDSPFWSPDGSQIAYTTPSGLAIADADGSNVRTFGFAASGPWHPGQ